MFLMQSLPEHIGAINPHFVFVCSARRRQPKHYANNMVASEVLYNYPMATLLSRVVDHLENPREQWYLYALM